MALSNVITTVCGRTFKIDMFEQLAVGIVRSEEFLRDQTYIPDTFAVYRTVSGVYLLETTTFRLVDMFLQTTYEILTEKEALKYLNNCMLDIS
jgi:UDP-glucose 6-dehydrogenase